MICGPNHRTRSTKLPRPCHKRPEICPVVVISSSLVTSFGERLADCEASSQGRGFVRHGLSRANMSSGMTRDGTFIDRGASRYRSSLERTSCRSHGDSGELTSRYEPFLCIAADSPERTGPIPRRASVGGGVGQQGGRPGRAMPGDAGTVIPPAQMVAAEIGVWRRRCFRGDELRSRASTVGRGALRWVGDCVGLPGFDRRLWCLRSSTSG